MLPLLVSIGLAAPPQGQMVEHKGDDYRVVTVDLRDYGLALVGQRPGEPHVFSELDESVVVATNAGIFHAIDDPVGLWVQDGEELHSVERDPGFGNFYLQPNGVFWVDGEGAHAAATEDFAGSPSIRLATQSGPMLVVEGEVHPVFNEDSWSKKLRSGVGILDPWTIVFAVSEHVVRFHDFATLFRDELGCDNALFLDGTISGLQAPGLPAPTDRYDTAGFLVATPRSPQSGVREGDVVFQRSKSSQAEAIALATGSELTHTGVVRMREGKPWVLEAVQPVKLTPLDAWVSRGVPESFVVRRPHEEVWTPDAVRRLDALQEEWLGRPYDLRFEPGTDKLYCSELVREAYLEAVGIEVAPLRPVSSYEVEDPKLREAIVARWGRVPSEMLVVAPSDLAESPMLGEVRR